MKEDLQGISYKEREIIIEKILSMSKQISALAKLLNPEFVGVDHN